MIVDEDIEYSSYVNTRRSNSFIVYKNKIKDEELVILCKQMAILLESGCEISQIIEIIKNQSNKKISNILGKVYLYIRKGDSITQSFSNTNEFSTFFISMIKSGELSGNLDKVMHTLSSYYEKEYKTKKKIKSVTIYPKIVIILAFMAMIVIMTFVIPNFEMIFISNGIDPPLLTKILINISKIIRTNLQYIMFVILIIIPILIHILKNNPRISNLRNNLKFKIPIVKNIFELIVTVRFCKTLGMMVKSGIHIVEAIEISSRVVDNNFIYERLMISKEYISQGNLISSSLSKSNIFPIAFISMIKTGEESGRLEESLDAAYDFYSNEMDTKIEKTMKLVEPIVILILGLFVGCFMIAMVMPMFDAITSI